MTYVADPDRYERMTYRRTGRSGLKLPVVSLGLWNNFGADRPLETSRAIVRRAFDLGITHFDLANNYGPPYGSAEETFGRLLESDLAPYRDELVVSTKAGYDMWPGPYGEWGSRKYLLASLDQSLGRMGLDYVDIFYSHRLDPETPARGDHGRPRRGRPPGKGALRRDLVLSAGRDARGRRDPRAARDAAPDPPAVVLDAQPVDRGRPSRHPRRARRRLHRVLPARPGVAHRPVRGRDPGGLADRPRPLALGRPAHRPDAGEGRRAPRDRRRPRADAALPWRSRGPSATPG